MLLAEDDVARLAKLGHDQTVFSEVDGDGYLRLRNVANESGEGARHCYFLKGGKCSVYADRPAGCRFYPLTLSEDGLKLVRDADCPHRSEFPMEASAGRRIRILVGTMIREARRRG